MFINNEEMEKFPNDKLLHQNLKWKYMQLIMLCQKLKFFKNNFSINSINGNFKYSKNHFTVR